ncbi:MAG: hypothetical protein ACPGMR_03200 [Pontibacterium sp.]
MSLEIDTGRIAITNTDGSLKLDTSIRHPVVLSKITGNVWMTNYLWDLYGNGGTSYPQQYPIRRSYEYEIGRLGEAYSKVPDFIICKANISDAFGTREVTIAGSDILTIGPGALIARQGTTDWWVMEEAFCALIHVYLDGTTVKLKIEFSSSHIRYPHEGSTEIKAYDYWLRKLPIVSTQPYGSMGEWRERLYRVDINYSVVVGKFMG